MTMRSTPGITVERRRLLWLPVAVASQALLAAAARAQEAVSAGGGSVPVPDDPLAPLTRAALGERWQALARTQRARVATADEPFVHQAMAWIARLPDAELATLAKPRPASGFAAGPTWQLMPCLTVEFQMAPGAELRLHNHPPQVVISRCIDGEVRFRHCEPIGTPPPCTRIDGTKFEVRETRTGVLKAGQMTSLTRVRDGMHGFVAGEHGARLVDFIATMSDDSSTFSYVALSDEPLDEERRTFEAVWTGK